MYYVYKGLMYAILMIVEMNPMTSMILMWTMMNPRLWSWYFICALMVESLCIINGYWGRQLFVQDPQCELTQT